MHTEGNRTARGCNRAEMSARYVGKGLWFKEIALRYIEPSKIGSHNTKLEDMSVLCEIHSAVLSLRMENIRVPWYCALLFRKGAVLSLDNRTMASVTNNSHR